MKAIGGYFELELDTSHHFSHEDGALVNSGRNALEYILLGLRNVTKVYLPYYTCEVVLEPLKRLNIPYEFYHINQDLEIDQIPRLGEGEYLIANNYFGIKDSYIEHLCEALAGKIIVDNSQAFFTPRYNGQPTFWSPRKFVGVPDGGIAKPKYDVQISTQDVSYDRCNHLLKRWDLGASEAYADFQSNDEKLIGKPLKAMSNLTHTLLKSISYQDIISKRKANYSRLRAALEDENLTNTPVADEVSCPMVYPFYTDDNRLRSKLINNKIFVAKYWPNIEEWCTKNDIELYLSLNIIPLPIDQRYDSDDMSYIASMILTK